MELSVTQSVSLQEQYYCGVCEELYRESEEEYYWICCDGCDRWFHGECVSNT